MSGAASVRNTAIKRIQGDVREMMTHPSDQYVAAPLEDNMFDWHFTLRGPRDTEFEGGVYHGRILLPADYPFKPPNIMLLTPNGRFEVRKKICLSISAHHPEEWQPAWGVRLILEALISFMPSKGEGAIGSLDFSAEERKILARKSVDFKCDVCGKVVDLLPALQPKSDQTDQEKQTDNKYASQIAQLHLHSLENKQTPPADEPSATSTATDTTATQEEIESDKANDAATSSFVSTQQTPVDDAVVTGQTVQQPAETQPRNPVVGSPARPPAAPQPPPPPPAAAAPARVAVPGATAPAARDTVVASDSIDSLLHYMTIGIVIALFALIYKKLLQWQGILPSS